MIDPYHDNADAVLDHIKRCSLCFEKLRQLNTILRCGGGPDEKKEPRRDE